MFGDWQPWYNMDMVIDFRCGHCHTYFPEGYDCPWCAFLGCSPTFHLKFSIVTDA